MELILELFVSPPHVQTGEYVALFLLGWLIEDDVIEVLEWDRMGRLWLFSDDEGVIDQNRWFIFIDEDGLIILVIKIRACFCALLDVLSKRNASVEDRLRIGELSWRQHINITKWRSNHSWFDDILNLSIYDGISVILLGIVEIAGMVGNGIEIG
jgi:hypothetical protein